MTTDFNDQQNEQATEHAPVAPPRGEIWMNDVKDTGRWGSRSRREVLAVVAAIIVMIVATATGVYLAAKNANQSNVEEPANNEPVGNTKLDPVTGKLVSAYELPKKPENILISDQQELDMIISALSSNNVTSENRGGIELHHSGRPVRQGGGLDHERRCDQCPAGRDPTIFVGRHFLFHQWRIVEELDELDVQVISL